MSRVLVIVPAYNEEAALGAVLQHLRETLPQYDTLVVDDGSLDNTARVAESVPGVKLVSLPINLGIGGAMQTGFKYALRHGYDIAVQCDADGQHPVTDIPRLVEFVEQGRADLAIGSRYVADTRYQPSFSRRVGKSLLSRLVDAVMGGGITDTTSGFRAANRAAFSLFARHYPEDYPEPEALVILYRAGLTAAEIPVEMHERQGGVTSITPHRAAYYIVKVALAIVLDLFRKFAKAPETSHHE